MKQAVGTVTQAASGRVAANNGAVVVTCIGDGSASNLPKGIGFLEVAVPITPMALSIRAKAQ